jgi:DNA-binding winged helix-turn-helix (wHTH) protein/tetratricopeptide (TPR) repeat protein
VTPSPPYAYRFDRFELRPRSRELLRDGRPVELQAKVFDLLAYLVQHPGRVIEKNELLDAVWPRQVVTEGALSRCAMKARRALEDDAADPRLLQTLHGRGFRWLADVQAVAAPSSPGAEQPAALVAAPSTGSDWRRRGGLAGLALIIALLAIGSWQVGRSDRALRGEGPLRIAVLPVANATGDPRHDWAGLALMGSIGEILRHGSGLRVLGASEALTFAEASGGEPGPAQLAALGEGFGVSHLLAGRLEAQPGGGLRFSYRLLGPAGQARRRTVVGGDIGALAQAAGADLRAVLSLPQPVAAELEDAFAGEAYLRGRAKRLQGDNRGALELFALAVDQAPEAFWPRYERALSLADLGDSTEARSELHRLLAEADAAPAPLPQVSVRIALAVQDWQTGRNDDARARLDEALTIAEQQGDLEQIAAVHTHLGMLAGRLADFGSAREHLGRAIEAELGNGQERPSGALLNSLAIVERRDGDLASADQHFNQALLQFRLVGDRRNEAATLSSLSTLRHRQGRYQESRDLAEQALAVDRALGHRSNEVSALFTLARAEAELGRLATAVPIAEESLALAEALGETPKAAQAHSLLGQLKRDLGRWDGAREHFSRAAAAFAADGDPRHAERQRYHLARLLLAEGRPVEAEHAARALLDALDADAPVRADLLRLLASARLAQDDPPAAGAWLEQAMVAHGPRRSGREWGWLQLSMAEQALASGAIEAARRAVAAAEVEIAGHYTLLRVAAALAAAEGDTAAALTLEEQARRAAGERWTAADQARLEERSRRLE